MKHSQIVFDLYAHFSKRREFTLKMKCYCCSVIQKYNIYIRLKCVLVLIKPKTLESYISQIYAH